MTCIHMCCASHHSTTLQVSGPSKMLLFEATGIYPTCSTCFGLGRGFLVPLEVYALSGEICEAVSAAAVVLAAQPRALSPQKRVQ